MQLFELFGSINIEGQDGVNNALDSMDQRAKKTSGGFSSLAGGVASAGLAIGAAVGAAAVAVGAMSVTITDDLQKSLNGLQASTGTTTEGMNSMKDAMLAVYNNNFGENFEEIGNVMTRVNQVMGVTGEELQKVTENAFTLSDTFEMDFEGSVDTVNSLMKNFGITSDEAFNIIASGAQNGANKNGDLLEVLNEYSPAFSDLGMSASDFAQTLVNGANEGVFAIDKVGDSVKEFGIRSKDMSDSSAIAFENLGLDADNMFKTFAEGGEESDEAFQQVVQGLLNIEDPLKQNEIGVALFGSTFEDMGVAGIKALAGVNESVIETTGVMDGINEVKYDSFSEGLEGLKRTLQTSILIPLGEMIIPVLEKFTNFINKNMPTIKAVIGSAMDSVRGAFEKVSGYLSGEGSTVWTTLTNDVIPPLVDLFVRVKDIYVPALLGVFEKVFPLIQSVVGTVFGVIVDDILPPLMKGFEIIYGQVIPALLNIIEENIPKIQKIWEDLWVILKPIIDGFSAAIQALMPVVSKVFKVLTDIIGKSIGSAIDIIGGIISFLKNVFTGNFSEALEDIKGVFTSIFDLIIGNAYDIGKNLLESLMGGITSAKDWLFGKIQDVGEGVINTFKNIFGIASPSKVMKGFGNNLMEGLSIGIEEKETEAQKAIKSVLDEIEDVIDDYYENRKQAQEDALESEYEAEKKHLEETYDLIESEYERNVKLTEIHYQKELSAIEKSSSNKLKEITSYNSKLTAKYQNQLNILNNYTEAEQKAYDDQQYNLEIAGLEREKLQTRYNAEQKLKEAETLDEIKEIRKQYSIDINNIENELAEKKAERAREEKLESIENAKELLRNKITSLEEQNKEEEKNILEQADKKKNWAKVERDMNLSAYKRGLEDDKNNHVEKMSILDSNLEQERNTINDSNEQLKLITKDYYKDQIGGLESTYQQMIDADKEAGVERNLQITADNETIIKTLESFEDDWEDTGSNFSSNMDIGIKSNIPKLNTTVAGIAKLAEKTGISEGVIKGNLAESKKLTKELDLLIRSTSDAFGYVDYSEIAEDIIGGLDLGIKTASSDLYNTVSDVAEGVIDNFNKTFSISPPYPSKEMETIGQLIVEGVANGVEDSRDVVGDTMTDILEDVESAIDKHYDDVAKLESRKIDANARAKKTRYKADYRATEKALKTHLGDLKDAYDDALDEIEKETSKRLSDLDAENKRIISGYQGEIDALNKMSEKEQAYLKESDDKRKYEDLKKEKEILERTRKEELEASIASEKKILAELEEDRILAKSEASSSDEKLAIQQEYDEKVLKEQQEHTQDRLDIESDYQEDIESLNREKYDLMLEKLLDVNDEARDITIKGIEEKIEATEKGHEEEIQKIEEQDEKKKNSLDTAYETEKKATEDSLELLKEKYETSLEDLDSFIIVEKEKLEASMSEKKRIAKEYATEQLTALRTSNELLIENEKNTGLEREGLVTTTADNILGTEKQLGIDRLTLVGTDNDAIITKLGTYESEFKTKGENFTSNLIDGLKTRKQELVSLVDEILKLVQNAEQQQLKLEAVKASSPKGTVVKEVNGGILAIAPPPLPSSSSSSVPDNIKNSPLAKYSTIYKFAEGGIITEPTLGVIGEAGESEAVLPLSELERLLPNKSKGGIVVNVNNPVLVGSDGGNALGKAIVDTMNDLGISC